ncbi:ferredoxin [Rhodococcus sp. 15-725-2-2b]|uniref:ferredoxin n=1 Tax=unclassified Rhodococcus (in: high G+C Gram-positive bacteria) TaxID=192944 RepID=UPI000B9C02A0|nr:MULTISPECIES: ferredoxin [unclassified Rhodococcus (in: high G+C Gram-positive bacteria)]OZC63631.1 ferredoxin [Rhodococcus sp. 06-469-3-2]OZD40796.1 ferredoxin [Rhodococcus sp. 06-1477-1A]OZE67096.1 ferredoxin [Rhodococcus sp. 15-725-2-2b]
MTYVIAEPCIDIMDKSCMVECPVDCIYEGGRMLYINPDECVDCGACEPACPVEAITYEDDVPEQWDAYSGINAHFFQLTECSGGAAITGPRNVDPPAVTLVTKSVDDTASNTNSGRHA